MEKRMLCYLAGMEPYYIKCIKDGPFQPKRVEGAIKPESQWTMDERRVVIQDQCLKSIIMSCLPDDIIESVISCETAKATWTDLDHSFEGLFDTKENKIMDLKLEQSGPKKDFQENFNDEADERTSEEYLKDLVIEFHERALLANSKRFIKRRNNFSIQKANEDLECYKCGEKGHFARDCFSKTFEPSYKSQVSNFSSVSPINPLNQRTNALLMKLLNWDEEEVSNDDEEMTQVKVLMALADDELSVGKNHARNGECIDITMRKVNIILFMNEDADWQNYLKYINVDLKFVEEQILNLLSKYNKLVFELNKCKDDLLVLKQAKLDAVIFQIQYTELTKLNHALQEQLKE
ncbi:retrovirus-related pol polyprotein from transposon TNT 1-94 [Tanacetum coccineum]